MADSSKKFSFFNLSWVKNIPELTKKFTEIRDQAREMALNWEAISENDAQNSLLERTKALEKKKALKKIAKEEEEKKRREEKEQEEENQKSSVVEWWYDFSKPIDSSNTWLNEFSTIEPKSYYNFENWEWEWSYVSLETEESLEQKKEAEAALEEYNRTKWEKAKQNDAYVASLRNQIKIPSETASNTYKTLTDQYNTNIEQGIKPGRWAKALIATRAGLSWLGQDISNLFTFWKIWRARLTNKTEDDNVENWDEEHDKQSQLLADDAETAQLKKDFEDFENSDEGKDLVEFVKFTNTLQDFGIQATMLSEEIEKADEAGNVALKEAKEIELENVRLEYYRNNFEYAFWERFEWDTLKDLLANVKKSSKWKKYSDKQLLNFEISEFADRRESWVNSYQTYADIAQRFIIRSNFNVWWLPYESVVGTIEKFWVIMWEDDKQLFATPYLWVEDELQEFDMQITKKQNELADAQWRWSKDEIESITKDIEFLSQKKEYYKIGMSYLTSYLEAAASNIANAGWTDRLNITYRTIWYLYKSQETQALKALLTDFETYDQFATDWKIDYEALWNYLENSKELRDFWALALAYKAQAEYHDKSQDLAEAETLFWVAYYWTRTVINDIYAKSPREQYLKSKYTQAFFKYAKEWWDLHAINDDTINELLWDNYDFVSIKEKIIPWLDYEATEEKGRRRWDVITDKVTEMIKSQDYAYATDYWKAMLNTLEWVGDTIQSDPGSAALTAAALMLPFLWWPEAAGGGAAALSKALWAWPTWQAIWRWAWLFAWEVTEWEIINVLLDSTSYWEPAPVRNLLDVWIWALRAVPQLRTAKAIWKMRKDIDWIIDASIKNVHWSAVPYSSLSKTEQRNVNKEINSLFGRTKETVWDNIILGQKITNFMDKEWKVDYEKFFSAYNTWRLKILWITWDEKEISIGRALQLKAFSDELQNLDERVIDKLYNKAVKGIWNKRLVEQISKWKLTQIWWSALVGTGKRAVVSYWLQQNLNAYSKIAKTKIWTYLVKILENWTATKWLSAKLNSAWSSRIEALKWMLAKATTAEEKAMFQNLIDSANELWANQRMLPLYVSEKWLDDALKLDKINVDNFKKQLNKVSDYYINKTSWKQIEALNSSLWKEWTKLDKSIASDLLKLKNEKNLKAAIEWWLTSLPSEILAAYKEGWLEWVARYIMWNRADLKKIWTHVYDIKELKKRINWITDSILDKWQKKRLNQLLDAINKINWWQINILELPESIRKSLLWVEWFMWYLKEWDSTETIIALWAWLVWWSKSKAFSDIKTLTHEIWHIMFLSLSDKVRSQIAISLITSLRWKDVTSAVLKQYVPNISKARISELLELYNKSDATEFVEELCADMLSQSLIDAIRWNKNAWSTIIDNLIDQMTQWKKLTDATKTSKPTEIIWNKFTDMLEWLYNAMSTQRWTKEFKWIMNYIAAAILEWKEVEWTARASREVRKSLNETKKSLVYGRKDSEFFAYKKAITDKADFNTQKEIWDMISAMDKEITSFDIAKVYSTSTIKDLISDSKISAEDLWQMLSTRRLSKEYQDEILKWISAKDEKKFLKAVDFAQTKQNIMWKLLMWFWENWKIDLTKKVDWYSFADILNNIQVKTTHNWYTEFGWIDFIKFLNSSDKDAYEKLFYNVMSNMWDVYDPKVIDEISSKLKEAWIKWSDIAWKADNDFAAMRVSFTNKVQDSITKYALAAWLDSKIAQKLAADTTSRLFAGSFYYMSNLYHLENMDPATLIDDMAYWLLLKNNKYTKWNTYGTYYDMIIEQYSKEKIFDERTANWLSTPHKEGFATDTNTVEGFRWRWYEREVFNRLAARTEEYLIHWLKDLSIDRPFLNLNKEDWVEFFNKAFPSQNQAESLIWWILAEKWITSDLLWITNKLNSATTTPEVADIYIDALSKKNIDVSEKLSDAEKESLIKRLENIRDNWFSDKDYDELLSMFESKYLANSLDWISLDDYFRWVLTIDKINELNKEWGVFTESLVNSVDPTWTNKMVEEFGWIWSTLDDPKVKEAVDWIIEEINNWNNIVEEADKWSFNTIAKYALDSDALKSFFNITDTKDMIRYKAYMSTSSNTDIQKMITVFESNKMQKIWKFRKWILKGGSVYINPASIAAKNPEIWNLLSKWLDFLNTKLIYTKWEWAIANYYRLTKLSWNEKYLVTRAIIDNIISSFEKCIKNNPWTTFEKISNDIIERYTTRFPTKDTVWWKSVWWTRKSREELLDPSKKINRNVSISDPELDEEYKAAVEAYVEILSKRHSDSWWLSKVELNAIMEWIWTSPNTLSRVFNIENRWSNAYKEASKLTWLKWGWLWLSPDEIARLDKTMSAASKDIYNKAYTEELNSSLARWLSQEEASKRADLAGKAARDEEQWFSELYNPNLFKNYLYNVYSTTSSTFNWRDKLFKTVKRWEQQSANLMYKIYYSLWLGWIPSATQQVVTNYVEIYSKTFAELWDFELDSDMYNKIMWFVWTLMPSELSHSQRAELESNINPTRRIWKWLKKWSNTWSNALYWADSSAENAVFRYALGSSFINAWFTTDSTKELISDISRRIDDLHNKWADKFINLEAVVKSDKVKAWRLIDKRIDKAIQDWLISAADWVILKNKLSKLNEASDPLRNVAKNANYQKNAFYQIAQNPVLVQNIIGGWAGPANMRFMNWWTRKAWEYIYNLSEAILSWDKQAFWQSMMSLAYRALIGTKIYIQVDKATSSTWWTDPIEFMKMIFLPYTVMNMALLWALDNVIDTVTNVLWAKEWEKLKTLLSNVVTNSLSMADTLKWRFAAAPLYWLWQIMSISQWADMLAEKDMAANYFSWIFSWVPYLNKIYSTPWLNQISQILEKARTNRINRFTTVSIGWVLKSPVSLYDQNKLINLLFWWYYTNDLVWTKKLVEEVNAAQYWSEKSIWDLSLITNSRNSTYAYRALWDYIYKNNLDWWIHPSTSNISELIKSMNDAYVEDKFYNTLTELWFDIDSYKEYTLLNYEENWWIDSTMPWYKKILSEQWIENEKLISTYASDWILNAMLLKWATYSWLYEAWKGWSTKEIAERTKWVIALQSEIEAEIEKDMESNPNILKNSAYNDQLIRDTIEKYGNRFGEEVLMATTIKAYITAYRSALRKYYQKSYGDSYKENLYDKHDKVTGEVIKTWINTEIEQLVAEEKNRMVATYYEAGLLWNEYIANTIIPVHAALLPDYPLKSAVNMKSTMWIAVSANISSKNIMYQWIWNMGIDWVVPEYLNKVLESNKLTIKEKFGFVEEFDDFVTSTYDPFTANWIKNWMAIWITKHYDELLREAERQWSDFFDTTDYIKRWMDRITVSQPLSDEAIKQQIRDSVYKKKTWSWSWSKWRKWSVSFGDLANKLTKFQAMKRNFERNVLWEEPLQRIAYKATSHWVTPIQLSIWEAHEIDQKYSFITPKKPESEKTPDIVVKQVKTSTSKYSGKAIKQSNVYKVKKIL